MKHSDGDFLTDEELDALERRALKKYRLVRVEISLQDGELDWQEHTEGPFATKAEMEARIDDIRKEGKSSRRSVATPIVDVDLVQRLIREVRFWRSNDQ